MRREGAMMLTSLTPKQAPPGLRLRRPRRGPSVAGDAATLAAESDRPEVQALIREGIRRGTLRVVPDPDSPDRVRVVRVAHESPTGALVHRIFV